MRVWTLVAVPSFFFFLVLAGLRPAGPRNPQRGERTLSAPLVTPLNPDHRRLARKYKNTRSQPPRCGRVLSISAQLVRFESMLLLQFIVRGRRS